MPGAVVEAMAQASTEFVELAGLHAAAGRKIASTVGVEAAHVSNGALQRLYVGGSVLYYGKRFGGRSTSAGHFRFEERGRLLQLFPVSKLPVSGYRDDWGQTGKGR